MNRNCSDGSWAGMRYRVQPLLCSGRLRSSFPVLLPSHSVRVDYICFALLRSRANVHLQRRWARPGKGEPWNRAFIVQIDHVCADLLHFRWKLGVVCCEIRAQAFHIFASVVPLFATFCRAAWVAFLLACCSFDISHICSISVMNCIRGAACCFLIYWNISACSSLTGSWVLWEGVESISEQLRDNEDPRVALRSVRSSWQAGISEEASEEGVTSFLKRL